MKATQVAEKALKEKAAPAPETAPVVKKEAAPISPAALAKIINKEWNEDNNEWNAAKKELAEANE